MISQPLKVSYANISISPLSPREADCEGRDGDYSSIEHRIRIRSDLPPAEQARVLVHEIIHAAFNMFSLGDAEVDEERVCEMLDGPLLTVLTDNPWLAGVLHQAVSHGKPIVEG